MYRGRNKEGCREQEPGYHALNCAVECGTTIFVPTTHRRVIFQGTTLAEAMYGRPIAPRS